MTNGPTRRDFLASAAALTALPVLPHADPASSGPPATFLDLRHPPDSITAQTRTDYRVLQAAPNGRWEAGRIAVSCTPEPGALRVTLTAPDDGIQRLHLRWRGRLGATRLLLGDAWERAYGDLEWRSFVPNRVMPWYVAAWDGKLTNCYGVRTGASAFCFWQVDPQGISLWADVRSGSIAIRLGDRELHVCDVVCRAGQQDQSPFAALHRFCRDMCPAPRLPAQPVYGHNDWYYAYGNNSEITVLDDTKRIVELSPSGDNRPFAVIDDGWQPERSADKLGVGMWDRGNERFPDMPGLANRIRQAGARAGIWIRPLLAPKDAPDAWRLSRARTMLDPTVPGVLEKVAADIGRLHQWGYDLIKHDYSTFDILGRWGSQMGSSLTGGNWTFAAGPIRTTAEVINELYRTIRTAAGDTLVIGCNSVSHLSAGQFEMCRIGDDTSGTEWERVPRMGVNALGFRAVQHGAFYVADPDCVGVTTAIPWELNRQWLDLLARSGTMTFVSLAPDAIGAEQRRDLRTALATAARPQPLREPLDWQETTWPTRWTGPRHENGYSWVSPDGAALPG